jgi:cell division protein FtsW
MGVALMMVSQAVVNMLVAVGLFPVTGQPLPLISMGGTSTIINCTYIGIILSVSRYTAGLRKKPTTNEADGALAPIEPSMKMFNDDEKLK